MKALHLLLFPLLLPWTLSAAPVAFSGKVAINGLNYSGAAAFTFALRDQNGTVHWRNGANADDPINVPVDRGHYVVLLGGQGMNPLPANLFLDHPELYLQVHFFRPDSGQWLHLQPDQCILSSPHALSAEVARNAIVAELAKAVEAGAVTKNMLAGEVLSDLNATINRSRLAADVLADLNRTFTISAGTVTEGMLAAGTVTPSKLSTEVVGALKPAILEQPQSVAAVGGGSASFATEATGGNLSYQWLQQGYAIAGANENVLTITDLNATIHDGNYSVTVTNAFGSTTSAVATLDFNGSVTQGLVGWWKFDEINGTTAYDSSGNGNDGNLSNGPTWTTGKIGGALSFDGVNDFVLIPHSVLNGRNVLSYSLWFYTTQTNAIQHTFLSAANADADQGNELLLWTKSHQIEVQNKNGVLGITSSLNADFWQNQWKNIILIYDVSSLSVYLNGQSLLDISSSFNSLNIESGGLIIGADQDSLGGGFESNQYINGLIDDVRIYDRALSTAEVQALYSLGSGASTTITSGGTIAANSVTMEKLSPQVRDDLNRTATVVGTGNFEAGLRAYLRPMLKGGVQKSYGNVGLPITLKAPEVDGRFLQYQWYKGGTPIAGATGTQHQIAEFNATRDIGDYEIRVSNAFAVLKTKAVLETGSSIKVVSGQNSDFTLLLKSDGSLWAVGLNGNGQLGDGSTTQRNSPVKIVDANVSFISAGGKHSLFLKFDGSLWAMGDNGNGQLGDGTTAQRISPVQVVASGVAQVAAGYEHSLFLKSDGSLHSMGKNSFGQLGDGTTTQRTSPVQVVASGVTQIAGGAHHSLFLKSDGSLWAMGYNSYGNLGDGSTTQRNSPVQVVASGVAQVAAGEQHSLFLKSDGSLWAMGYNNYGQLGIGNTTNKNTPVQVVASGVTQIAAGAHHSLFLKSDGSLWAMGRNNYGQFGDGTTTNKNSPVQVVSSGVNQVAGGYSHSLFLKSDGSLWGMGRNDLGELGDDTQTNRNSPVKTTDLISTIEQPYVAETAADVTDP